MLNPLPLTCGVVIDGAVISRLNICYEILLLLLDLVMGSLSLSHCCSQAFIAQTHSHIDKRAHTQYAVLHGVRLIGIALLLTAVAVVCPP